jgi:hypothetical protein
VRTDAKLADVGVAKKVETFVPNPDTPVEIGIPETELITPPDVVVTYPAVVRGRVTVPVNVGDALGARILLTL